MVEKKRFELAKIDIFTEDFEWLNINMKFKVEEMAEVLQMVLGGDISSLTREKFLTSLKKAESK